MTSPHIRSLLRVLVAVVALAGVGSNAAAQNNTLDLRVAELDERGNITYQNFIYARLVASQRVILQANYLRIPGSPDYNEVAVAAGLRLTSDPRFTMYGMMGVANATDAVYLEPALFITSVAGKFSASAYMHHYTPVDDKGIDQWLADPIEAQYVIARKVAVGASAYFYRPNGGTWLTKVGPKISVGDKWGATELRIGRVSTTKEQEFQIRRLFVF